jgi:hypothetical protein
MSALKMKLYSILTRPDEEYLSQMAEQAIYATYLHLKNLEKQNILLNINFINVPMKQLVTVAFIVLGIQSLLA